MTPYPPGRVDIVIGDRHGAACADEIVATLEELMRGHGLRVVRNKPYSGGFITQNYGAPANGRHAIQIEINRALYLDERTLDRSAWLRDAENRPAPRIWRSPRLAARCHASRRGMPPNSLLKKKGPLALS